MRSPDVVVLVLVLVLGACGASGPEPLTGPCGGDPGLYVFESVADGALGAQIKSYELVAREAPANGDGCSMLWSTAPTGLPENRRQATAEVAKGGVLFPIELKEYDALDVLVYGHTTADPAMSTPIAGGCGKYFYISGEETQCLLVAVTAKP